MNPSIAFLFPGQGSQKVGMGKAFFDAFPLSRQVFEQVDHTLGYALSRMIFEGEPVELTRTDRAQPALFAVSQAMLAIIDHQLPGVRKHLAGVAGHSLGEYSALVAAGGMTLEEGARLLSVRGQGMWEAGQATPGTMMAVLGVDLEALESLIAEHIQGVCVIANDNAPGQVIISGEVGAVERCAQTVKEKLQKKVIPLDVSGAFHSPLMASAAESLEGAIKDVVWSPLNIPVIANVTGHPIASEQEIGALLVQQVCGRVRWRETILNLYASGVRVFIEIGSGKVLTGLCSRILSDGTFLSLQTPKDLELLTPWA